MNSIVTLIHPGVLWAGYGLAYLLGKVAYIVPGGIGILESSMAAVYANLAVPNSINVVILSYRLLSFWITIVCGFAAAGYLEKEANGEDLSKGFTIEYADVPCMEKTSSKSM